MKQRHPFEQLLDQITDLLALTEENKRKVSSGKLDPAIQDKLDQVEKDVELFHKITQNAIKKSGINQEVLDQNIGNPPDNLPSKERKILERAQKLKKELESEERKWAIKKSIVKRQEKKAKTIGKKRKKKFKRLGGEGWMPL